MSSPVQIRKYQEEDLSEMVRITNDRSIAMGEPPAITEERLLRRFEQYIFGLQIEQRRLSGRARWEYRCLYVLHAQW